MNKNLIIAFLIGVIITLVAVNYLTKFDIKIEMAKKTEPLKIDEIQKDDSFLNETTEIVNNTISKNKKTEEKPLKASIELKVKEEKTNPLDKYLPNKDKYKDLESSQYSYSESVEVEERTDPFVMPDRPKAIKEPDIPLIDIPETIKPKILVEKITNPLSTDNVTNWGKDYHLVDNIAYEAVALVTKSPLYPKQAIQKGLGGLVLIEFKLKENGTVIDPVVIFFADPEGIFNRSALKAIVKWKFKPRISLKGKNIKGNGYRALFTYELPDNNQLNEPKIGVLANFSIKGNKPKLNSESDVASVEVIELKE